MKRKTFVKLAAICGTSTLVGMKKLGNLEKYADTLPNSDRMPILFLGHGSPMNAIEENEFVRGFREVGETLPSPRTIVCISAHWYTKGTKVTAMEMPRTIHDFGGFPQALYEVSYPAKGNPKLAKTIKQELVPTEVELDDKWGLDHGAWSVIKHLYPKANTPVIQLSIDYTKPPEYHYGLAKRLNSLRNKGILIIGSGNIVHNLRMMDLRATDRGNYGYDWALEAQQSVNALLKNGDYKPLLEYKKGGSAIQLAIPTPDHFLPLVYTLGLQHRRDEMKLFNDKLVGGSISMTSLKLF